MGSISRQQKPFKEVKQEETVDRISNLPNSLIAHILSFLPTKYAVGTSILSTKWKQLWTYISNLDFDDQLFLRPPDSDGDQCHTSFMKFVYRVLLLLKVSNVNKFSIKCSEVSDISDLNAWISAALSRDVRELDLYIPLKGSARLPADLFTCNTLVILKLGKKFVLNIPGLVCLQNLKTLHLDTVEFRDDESIKRLFSRCPVLEVLVLLKCEWKNISVLNISASALKSLIISYPVMKRCKSEIFKYKLKMELNTPSLQYLEYIGYLAEVCSIKNLHSLVKAHIDVQTPLPYLTFWQTLTIELAQGISNVHILHLSGNSIQALAWSSYKLPVFHNLTCLELGASCPGWLLLPRLLESSPQLRTLVFKEGLSHADYVFHDGYYWDHCEPVPACLLFHLKVIDFGAFKGEEGELKIVTYFLKNGKVLETLNISPLMSEAEELKITKLLLKIPRGSSSCKVVVS